MKHYSNSKKYDSCDENTEIPQGFILTNFQTILEFSIVQTFQSEII